MSTDKDMYDVIYNKYIKKMMDYDKNIDDKKIDESIIEDNMFCSDMSDEISDKDIREDELYKIFSEDHDKKTKANYDLVEPKMFVNCKLKVDFDTKNKMIYLYPGKSQYFTADILKCCGDVTIKYKGCYTNDGIRGNLAIYKIIESGIIAEAYSKIDPKKKDFLKFTAIDECTKECYDFMVVFSSNLCKCCY